MNKRNLMMSVAVIAAAVSAAPVSVSALEGQGTTSAVAYNYDGSFTESTIDISKKGSITLYKYVNNDGSSITPTGTEQSLSDMENAYPKAGITFHYAKVGDIDQITENTKTGIYYTNINTDLRAIFADYGVTLAASSDVAGGQAFEAEALNTALQQLIKKTSSDNTNTRSAYFGTTGEDALRTWAKANGTAMAVTDDTGKTSATDLDLGLYLVAETAVPAATVPDVNSEVDVFASPFFVSVPMTNIVDLTINDKTYEAGTLWQYDMTVYPKNQSIGIHKDIITDDYAYDSDALPYNDMVYDIVIGNGEGHNDGNDKSSKQMPCETKIDGDTDNNVASEWNTNYETDKSNISGGDGLTHQIDANIGDIISQVISADVPALSTDIDGTRKLTAYYDISDTMTYGLTFHKVTSVRLGTGDWNDPNNALLSEGTDYIVVKTESSVADDEVDSTDKKLAERNTLTHDNSDGGKYFRVILTDAGLAKMNAIGEHASYVYIQFQSVLTSEALIGTDGQDSGNFNENTAKLTYSSDRSSSVGTRTSNTPKVYTYRLNMLKTFTDSTGDPKQPDEDDFSAVKFVMTGSRENMDGVAETEELYFVYMPDNVSGNVTVDSVVDTVNGNDVYEEKSIPAQSGHYQVMDPVHDLLTEADKAAFAELTNSANDDLQYMVTSAGLRISKIVSPANVANTYTYEGGSTISIPVGGLVIDGLDAREYKLTEIATAEGRNLLADPVTVVLTAPVNGSYDLEDGSLAEATVQSGSDEAVALSGTSNGADLSSGTTSFEIKNNETIKLLRTGGEGVKVFYGLAAVAGIAGLAVLLAKKKQEENNA